MNPNLGNAYFASAVKSATPSKLIVMLYDGLIRFATDTRDALAEGRSGAEAATRCFRILTELNTCLRPEIAPDLCGRLSALYEFYTMEISRAMHTHSPDRITKILPLITQLRDAWEEADGKPDQEQSK
jgi:flagellar protein FliS